jgi:hypothetical protein
VRPPTAVERWISEFIFLDDTDFANFFELPYKVTRDTKLLTFQYTILHKIIPCGATLHTWNILDSSDCTYCEQYDSVSYFYFDCPIIQEFWNHVIKWIKNNMDVEIPLRKIDVLFGIPLYDTFMLCLNFIILQAKWHIYKNKLNNKHPFLFEFLTELKNAIEIERYIMIRNDSVYKFEQKWQMLYEALF